MKTSTMWFIVPVAVLTVSQLRIVRAGDETGPTAGERESKRGTNWRIEPSLKYDALCLLNTLTGDPFYLWHYSKAYAQFAPKLTPEARRAVANLKKIIKDEGKGIISANLCLYFSATDDVSLEDMLATARDPDRLRERFAKTSYWSEEGWRRFDSVRGDLQIVLAWLKAIGFEEYWRESVRPVAATRADEMLSHVRRFNIVPVIEAHLGRPLESDTITVYMLTFSQPHGIKITGTRFLTDVAWPFEIVVRNAVHEMMHPPYVLQGDSGLEAVLSALRGDAFLMHKVENHNPSFGYNDLEGFVEEDCVQALEQLITEHLGVADEARSRWKKSDDGMHVLAVALYRMMKLEKYPFKDKCVRDFLVRMHKGGRLKPGSIEAQHLAMYGKPGS